MTRRFFQFSLATMLVFVALICVVLAVRTNRQHNRRVAIAKVEKLGGRLEYFSTWKQYTKLVYSAKGEIATANVPKFGPLAWLMGDDASSQVWAVRFHDDGKVTDADLASVLPLREIQVVTIRHSEVTDVGVLSLASFPNLMRVDLTGNTILTEDGIARLERALPDCQIIK